MPAAEGPQLPDIVLGVLLDLHGDLHPARVDDQEQQQVDCPMPDVLELLSLDETRDGPSDRPSLRTWKFGISSTATAQRPRRANRSALP